MPPVPFKLLGLLNTEKFNVLDTQNFTVTLNLIDRKKVCSE